MFDYFYGQSGEMFSYFRVPKILFRDIKFKDLSTDAKTLYGILLDRMGLSVKNGWLDEQGRVYIIFPVQEVMDALGCADNSVRTNAEKSEPEDPGGLFFFAKFWRTTTMNTTIDFKTAKTIENMSRKIDGMERAVSGFFNKMSNIAERK